MKTKMKPKTQAVRISSDTLEMVRDLAAKDGRTISSQIERMVLASIKTVN